MATMKKITDHEWQDLACMGLGVLILLSPWVVPNDDMGIMTVNTVLVGLAVLLVSELELAGHSAREEAANAAAGLWLMGSPFVFGYAGELRLWHLVLGALVVAFAAVEFWQERKAAPRRTPR
jgi:hypothetical protein